MGIKNLTVIRIEDHTDDVMKAVEEKVRLALPAMGQVVENHAKRNCPVDTGRLRNSITHSTKEDSDGLSEHVGSAVEYAPYVEFIDRYYHPVGKAHFLRDGATKNIKEIKEVAETILEEL